MILVDSKRQTLSDKSKAHDVTITDTETGQTIVLNAIDEDSAFTLEMVLCQHIAKLTVNKVF